MPQMAGGREGALPCSPSFVSEVIYLAWVRFQIFSDVPVAGASRVMPLRLFQVMRDVYYYFCCFSKRSPWLLSDPPQSDSARI